MFENENNIGFIRFMRTLQVTVIICVLCLTSCKDSMQGQLFINLNHVVDDEMLVFEDKMYLTAAGHGYQVFRMKYYLSNFALEDKNGARCAIDAVHLVDAQDSSTCEFVLSPITLASPSKISFVFGLDEIINVEGGLENNFENANMEWPIMGEKGYHCMKFEGRYDSMQTGKLKNYHLHTGPTENNLNYVRIELDMPKELNLDSDFDVQMEMNIHNLLHGPNNYNFSEFGHGIMANQRAQETLKENGHDVFRIISITEHVSK